MGASPSGTLTLLALILIGPIIYAGNWAYVKLIKGGSMADPDHVAEKEGEREQLSSKQYLFALVGYAIGKYTHECILRALDLLLSKSKSRLGSHVCHNCLLFANSHQVSAIFGASLMS